LVFVILIGLIASAVIAYKLSDNDKFFLNKFGMFDRTFSTLRTGIYYLSHSGFTEALKSISNYRYFYWEQALAMGKDYPITGVGFASYSILLPNYFTKNRTGPNIIDYSGNYYLEILSELGFPALFLILIVFFIVLKKVVIYFKKNTLFKKNNNTGDWVLIGLMVSFITMLIALIFGAHTNFLEIQFAFWLIIGLLLSYVRINDINNNYDIGKTLRFPNRLNFSILQRVSLAIVLFIFSAVFLISSVTTLSINVAQNLYDKKNNYKGWENIYGLYKQDKFEGKPVRWSGIDASEVVDKKGNSIIIPVRDVIPKEYRTPLVIKIFIDNLAVKNVIIGNGEWQYIKIRIPDFTKEKFTITFVLNRSWIPKDVGLNRDTRELGIMIGDYSWED
jgi:hypothetical protein